MMVRKKAPFLCTLQAAQITRVVERPVGDAKPVCRVFYLAADGWGHFLENLPRFMPPHLTRFHLPEN